MALINEIDNWTCPLFFIPLFFIPKMAHSKSETTHGPAASGLYYQLTPSLSFRPLHWANGDFPHEKLMSFRSFDRIMDWPRVIVEPLTHDEVLELGEEAAVVEERFRNGISDCPALTAVFLLFSDSAVSRYRDLFELSGELLPVRRRDTHEDYHAFHCLTQIDLLDLERSIVETYSPGGRLRSIIHPVFRTGCNTDGKLFRINGPNPFQIFADEALGIELHQNIKGLDLIAADRALRI